MYYIGIDLGGTNIKAGVCDENGKILIPLRHTLKRALNMSLTQ